MLHGKDSHLATMLLRSGVATLICVVVWYDAFTHAWRVHAGAQSIHAYILCTWCMMLRWSSVGDVAARLRALTMGASCTPCTIWGATDPAARPVCLVSATSSRPRSVSFFWLCFTRAASMPSVPARSFERLKDRIAKNGKSWRELKLA